MKLTQKRYRAADDQGGAVAFCPNCGAKVTPGDEFCGNCGFNLVQYHAENASSTSSAASQPATSATTSQAAPKSAAPQPTATTAMPHRQGNGGNNTKQRALPQWAWWVIGVVAVILVGGYLFGRNYYTRSAQLDRTITAIKSGKGALAKDFTSTDPNLKLSDKKVKPLVRYFKHNPQALADFKRQLMNGQTSDGLFTYQLTGKHWLLFDKYQIHVKPVYPTATTNRTGAKIKVDGKTVATATRTSYSKQLGPLVPGKYTIASQGTVSGKPMTNQGTYDLMKTDQSVDLALRTVSFTVETAPKTVIYVNGKQQGKADSAGELVVSELPWSGNLEVTGEYKHGSSTVSSKASKVTSDNQTINLAFAGVMSLDDADSYMDGLWTIIQALSNSGDLSDADGLEDYYTDGTNNPQYKEMVRMAKGYYNDDNLTGIEYDSEVRAVVPLSKNKSIITYYLTYRFGTDDGTHLQEFSYNAETVKQDGHYRIVKVTGGDKIRDTHEDD